MIRCYLNKRFKIAIIINLYVFFVTYFFLMLYIYALYFLFVVFCRRVYPLLLLLYSENANSPGKLVSPRAGLIGYFFWSLCFYESLSDSITLFLTRILTLTRFLSPCPFHHQSVFRIHFYQRLQLHPELRYHLRLCR